MYTRSRSTKIQYSSRKSRRDTQEQLHTTESLFEVEQKQIILTEATVQKYSSQKDLMRLRTVRSLLRVQRLQLHLMSRRQRSEERRVGKEGRSGMRTAEE